MKNYNVEHLIEHENIDAITECLCQKVCGRDRKVRIHNHDFYEIFLTLSDTNHFINGKREKLSRGYLVFVKPSDIHGIIYDNQSSCEIINFSFSSRLLQTIADYLSISLTFIDNMHHYKVILSEFDTQRLVEKLSVIINDNPDIIYTRFVLFELVSMFLNTTSYSGKIFPKWFEDLCIFMKKHENFVDGIGSMTKFSGKSREYIARSFKKFLGVTPTEFVNDLRLTYAASQIINTNSNITDISLSSGFESSSWFNKMFIKKYGISPSKFRKKDKNYESADI